MSAFQFGDAPDQPGMKDSGAKVSEPAPKDAPPMLRVGARVRSRSHPELTGRIQAIEWQKPWVPSVIPYKIAWDNNGLAHDVLGWFFVYASDDSVEAAS